MASFKLKTKNGKVSWHAGVALDPEEWREVEIAPREMQHLRIACLPLREGGTLECEPNPFPEGDTYHAALNGLKPGEKASNKTLERLQAIEEEEREAAAKKRPAKRRLPIVAE